MFDKCRNYYNTEVSVYKALKKLKGKSIPRLNGKVRFDKLSFIVTHSEVIESTTRDEPEDELTEEEERYFKILDLIIEYIKGFNLFDIEVNVSKNTGKVLSMNLSVSLQLSVPTPS